MSDEPGLPEAKDDQVAADRMLQSIHGLDLTSADGRAGLMTVLREIERAAPGAIERLSADIQIRRAAGRYPEAFARAQ